MLFCLFSCEQENVCGLIGEWQCVEKTVLGTNLQFNPGWLFVFDSDFTGTITDPDSVKFTIEQFTWRTWQDSVEIAVLHNYTQRYQYQVYGDWLWLSCKHHTLMLSK